ncbi:glycine zipper 2TM domain-containing protein [Candidatus Babeliales bacterium]|nr:glycine zipper 2TM domain-containing protein [Candidatus Babeliales bacterium]
MNKIMIIIQRFLLLGLIVVLAGCGKHEASGGALGAVSGAVVGNAVSGGRSKGVGTLVGAALGNMLGREVGKSADKQEEDDKLERRIVIQEQRLQEARLTRMRLENERLRCQVKNWCANCCIRVTLCDAQRCPDCGDRLVREKCCKRCAGTFEAHSRYRYCPYCPDRVILSYR